MEGKVEITKLHYQCFNGSKSGLIPYTQNSNSQTCNGNYTIWNQLELHTAIRYPLPARQQLSRYDKEMEHAQLHVHIHRALYLKLKFLYTRIKRVTPPEKDISNRHNKESLALETHWSMSAYTTSMIVQARCSWKLTPPNGHWHRRVQLSGSWIFQFMNQLHHMHAMNMLHMEVSICNTCTHVLSQKSDLCPPQIFSTG